MNQSGAPFLGTDYYYSKGDIVITKSGFDLKTEFEKWDYINRPIPIIFIKTVEFHNYIDVLLGFNKKFILITVDNFDLCTPYLGYPCNDPERVRKSTALLESPYLVKWCSKNPAILHPKLQALPIGPKWNWRSTEYMSEDKTEHLRIFISNCLGPDSNFRNKNIKKNLLYFNYTEWTSNDANYQDHKYCRRNITRILKNNGFAYCPNQPFENYIKTLSTYKFSVSPPGAGIDTHRTWESLMVGTIPIMLYTALDPLFKDLPVILVNDFSEVNHEFLERKYEELQNREYDFSILYSMYWDQFIVNLRNGSL